MVRVQTYTIDHLPCATLVMSLARKPAARRRRTRRRACHLLGCTLHSKPVFRTDAERREAVQSRSGSSVKATAKPEQRDVLEAFAKNNVKKLGLERRGHIRPCGTR